MTDKAHGPPPPARIIKMDREPQSPADVFKDPPKFSSDAPRQGEHAEEHAPPSPQAAPYTKSRAHSSLDVRPTRRGLLPALKGRGFRPGER